MWHEARPWVLVAFSVLFALAFGLPNLPPCINGDRLAWAQTGGASPDISARLKALEDDILQNDHSFVVGHNPAMEYPLEGLCGLKEPPNWREKASFRKFQALLALPSRFDWRESNGVTPVKNQGGCGSCWAFGTVGVMESQVRIRVGLTEDLSEQYLVSCNADRWGCDGGWWAHDYHEWRAPSGEPTAGAVLETGMPYQSRDLPCNPPHSHAYRLASWSYVDTWSPDGLPTVDELKQAIYTYGPIGVAVAVGPAFQGYRGGVFDKDEWPINHAVVLVGWDDNFQWNGRTYGVWILKNSWGTGWGVNGFMYIKYGTSRIGYAATYADLRPQSVAPPEGTIGTVVTILGSNVGDTKPLVYLRYQDPSRGTTVKKKLKLLQWSGSSILALCRKGISPGSGTLVVQPSWPKGAAPIPVGEFRGMEPSIDEVIPSVASPGSTVEIRGEFFSTGKLSVSLVDPIIAKGKKCQVLNRHMDPATGWSTLEFVVPALAAQGYDLVLRNPLGQAVSRFTVQ